MLAARDITVAFDRRCILDGVSLDAASGEVVALLGPSGSGKSTLLRVIAGLLVPDGGRVIVDGRDVTDLPAHRRGVGLVFQDEQLFPHLTVAGNVEYGLRVRGVDRGERQQRVAELLALVGIEHLADRAVQRLSGGEAKRVAVARSLAPRPSVVLLDEPLTGLDHDLHDRLAGELAALLRTSDTTAVLVTHDRGEAATIADRIVELVGPHLP